MATQINYKQIKAEADLYKYQIVPSISSWSITVALKNYLWQDPSVTTPVKVQIWDTVRTITYPCSSTEPSWLNIYNAWSSELATKEIDYFVYLQQKPWEPIYIWFSRIPNAITSNDFNPVVWNEKYSSLNYNNNWQNAPVVNIGRFSAILSASPYTWSTPSAGFQVINYPIFESKLLEYYWYYYTNWTTWTTNISYDNKYKIVWSEVHLFIWNTINSISWSTWIVKFRLPFNLTNNTVNEIPINWFICKYGENPITQWKWQPIITTSSSLDFLVWVDAGAYTWDLLTNERIRINWFYQI